MVEESTSDLAKSGFLTEEEVNGTWMSQNHKDLVLVHIRNIKKTLAKYPRNGPSPQGTTSPESEWSASDARLAERNIRMRRRAREQLARMTIVFRQYVRERDADYSPDADVDTSDYSFDDGLSPSIFAIVEASMYTRDATSVFPNPLRLHGRDMDVAMLMDQEEAEDPEKVVKMWTSRQKEGHGPQSSLPQGEWDDDIADAALRIRKEIWPAISYPKNREPTVDDFEVTIADLRKWQGVFNRLKLQIPPQDLIQRAADLEYFAKARDRLNINWPPEPYDMNSNE